MSEESQCAKCGLSLVPINGFYVVRPCSDCGKDTYVFERDPKTSGMIIKPGDRAGFSVAWLMKQARLVGGGRFSRAGLKWYAKTLFVPRTDIVREPAANLVPLVTEWAAEAAAVIESSGLLKGLESMSDDGQAAGDELVRRIGERQETPEFWAYLAYEMCSQVLEAIEAGNAMTAAGAAAMAASARAMLKYKTELEEAVWRGHSVEALREAVTLWQNNRLNDSEEFWQQMFQARSFVLSQVFSTPVVVMSGKAYVGGKSVENTGGSLADFLMRNEVTSRTAIVELKLPTAALLTGQEYRNGVYPPSNELAGAVAQVTAYAASLAEDPMLRVRTPTPFDPARAECVVLIGTGETELVDEPRTRSFELYRAELRTVRVVTYDELFRRVESLLRLFGG